VKLTIKVTTLSAGKKYEELVETSLATIIKWERHYKRRAGDLAAGFAVEDLAYMAWVTLQAQGLKESFDAWVEKLDELEVVESEESHPTGGVATGDS